MDAVSFLHRRCVVHRDLKLSNLLYTNTGARAPPAAPQRLSSSR